MSLPTGPMGPTLKSSEYNMFKPKAELSPICVFTTDW